MKYLFIIHASPDDAHVDRLAEELSIRGVPSLADHRGGLAFSDYVPDQAPRLIEEECQGCLVYATDDGSSDTEFPPVFTSDFVRRLEVPAAIRARERDSGYMLATVPHGIKYARLGELSVSSFGTNLANHHTAAISGHPETLLDETMRVAKDVMEQTTAHGADEPVQISFNTWRSEAPRREDLLSVDWCTGLGNCKTPSGETCAHLISALYDIERAISRRHRGKRLTIKGNFHLSAGIALGYAFSRYPLDIETSDGAGSWVTGPATVGPDPFHVQGSACEAASSSLYVGISASDKDVRPSVRQHVAKQGRSPFYEVFLKPSTGLSRMAVTDEAMCRAMADQCRREIAQVASRYAGAISEIHIFAAVPKTLAVMLGHGLSALPPIQLYEHNGLGYHPTFRLGAWSAASGS